MDSKRIYTLTVTVTEMFWLCILSWEDSSSFNIMTNENESFHSV